MKVKPCKTVQSLINGAMNLESKIKRFSWCKLQEHVKCRREAKSVAVRCNRNTETRGVERYRMRMEEYKMPWSWQKQALAVILASMSARSSHTSLPRTFPRRALDRSKSAAKRAPASSWVLARHTPTPPDPSPVVCLSPKLCWPFCPKWCRSISGSGLFPA